MPYPNFEGKHLHDPLVTPSSMTAYWIEQGILPGDVQAPPGIIMLYQRRLLRRTIEAWAVTPFAPRHDGDPRLGLWLVDDTEGQVGIVGDFGIGAPAATIVLETLATIGARQFVTIGTAGSLRAELATGDVAVCDRAVRDEGVSHHYLPHQPFAHPTSALTERLQRDLREAGLDPVVASSWTIDAPYQETVAEAQHYLDQGVAVVEMEAAALFTVAQCRGLAIAAAFAISDSLAGGRWSPQFHDDRLATNLDTMVGAAVTTLTDPAAIRRARTYR